MNNKIYIVSYPLQAGLGVRSGLLMAVVLFCFTCFSQAFAYDIAKLDKIKKRVESYTINSSFKDDFFGLVVIKEALKSIEEGSGGIGACLVDKKTGKVVEHGRNRQYDGYFRSDLHAEMDLLNRYENKMKKKRDPVNRLDPRDCKGLVLVSSVEPCPMCLTRIINSGIRTVLYVAEDEHGGMVTRLECLPPFWREFAEGRVFRQADCSPELKKIAHDLFYFSHRNFAKHKPEKK